MHPLAHTLALALAAEKSKVPFYIVGGLLVAWALILSLGLGLRKPSFPGGPSGERAVIAVTVLLVLGALSTAVITSGTPAKEKAAAGAAPASSTAAPAPPASAPASTTSTGASPPAAPPPPAGTPLKLAANPSGALSFEPPELVARAGKVTIVMTNASPSEHDVAIEQGGHVLAAVSPFVGGSRTLTTTLKPGTYVFFCTVPGHRENGMHGTLRVL